MAWRLMAKPSLTTQPSHFAVATVVQAKLERDPVQPQHP